MPSSDLEQALAGSSSPGAVMVTREGRSVAAHYGSVAAEVAVCSKSVGLAFRTDLEILDVQGREAWLERLLARTLAGRVPEVATATVVAGTRCCRLDARRALVVGPPDAVGRWRRVTREALIAGCPVAATDLTAAHVALSLLGPKAGRLLLGAGLPDDVPPGGVRGGWLEGDAIVLLREDTDRYLLLLAADGAEQAFRALLDAGRSVGLSLVGADAVGRLAAAATGRG